MLLRGFGRRAGVAAAAAAAGRRGVAAEGIPGIAVIDDLYSPDAARSLDAAFQRTGFAVVTGHGVDFHGVRQAYRKGLEFFRLPVEEKQRFNMGRGYGFGGYLNQEEAAAQLLGDFKKPNDLVESLTLPGGLPRLDGTAGDVPDLIAGFDEAVGRLHEAMLEFRRRLDILVADALGEERETILDQVDPTLAGIRMAYYPPQSTAPEAGQMRYGEHVDSGGITILIRDEAAPWGTQVRLSTGEWVDVPINSEDIVLNVGALLSRWTNGRWRASIHRVANDPAERLSIVTGACVFKPDATIRPLPSCVSPGRPSRYEPVTAGEFLRERVKLHRDSYADECGMSRAEAEDNFQQKIQTYEL